MKKLLVTAFLSLIVGCTGCSFDFDPQVVIAVENTENLYNTVFGESALIEIGGGLYYDSTTRIVYWWNGYLYGYQQSATTPSPYYAPNGKPYKYNPEKNAFEEIE